MKDLASIVDELLFAAGPRRNEVQRCLDAHDIGAAPKPAPEPEKPKAKKKK
jgi:hypothetical protein